MVLLLGLNFARLSGLTELREREQLLFSESLNRWHLWVAAGGSQDPQSQGLFFFLLSSWKQKWESLRYVILGISCTSLFFSPVWGSVCCSLHNESLDPSVPSWVSHSQILEAWWEVDFNFSCCPLLSHHKAKIWFKMRKIRGESWSLCFFSGVIFSQKNPFVSISGGVAHCLKQWHRIFLKQWGGECTEVVSQSESKNTLWRLFLLLDLFCYFPTCKNSIQASGQMNWVAVYHVLITVIKAIKF